MYSLGPLSILSLDYGFARAMVESATVLGRPRDCPRSELDPGPFPENSLRNPGSDSTWVEHLKKLDPKPSSCGTGGQRGRALVHDNFA